MQQSQRSASISILGQVIVNCRTMINGAMIEYTIPMAARLEKAGYIVPQVRLRNSLSRFHLDRGVAVSDLKK